MAGLGDLEHKLRLVDAVLAHISSQFGMPTLHFAGWCDKGVANIDSGTGAVRIQPQMMQRLTVSELELVLWHEAGHLYSSQRRTRRRLQELFKLTGGWSVAVLAYATLTKCSTAPWLGALVYSISAPAQPAAAGATALVLGATLHLSRWLQRQQVDSFEERIREEVRADAFAAHFVGQRRSVGLPWMQAMHRLWTGRPRVAHIMELRCKAQLELQRRALLESAALRPEQLPELKSLKGARPLHGALDGKSRLERENDQG